MEVQINPPETNQSSSLTNGQTNKVEDTNVNCEMLTETNPIYTIETVMEYLANNDDVLCKSQQRHEEDISKAEKSKILLDIFEKSKSNFLLRFGQFLNAEQAKVFEQFQEDSKDGYEVEFHLKNMAQMRSKRRRHKHMRNKRFAALKRLEKDSYFSETEMMKRNPLLYEQLVGQYLSTKEKRLRDYARDKPKTFVGALMSGIEKEQIEEKRKEQEEAEDAVMEEEEDSEDSSSTDSDDITNPKPSTSKIKQRKPQQMLWGEFEDVHTKVQRDPKSSAGLVSADERKLLKDEFVSIMYESFLDGHDDDFDYKTVDNNDEYDNIEILEHDEEEKYFDAEEPEDTTMDQGGGHKKKAESSEDELDMYMNALNQHPAVCQLSEHIKKL